MNLSDSSSDRLDNILDASIEVDVIMIASIETILIEIKVILYVISTAGVAGLTIGLLFIMDNLGRPLVNALN